MHLPSSMLPRTRTFVDQPGLAEVVALLTTQRPPVPPSPHPWQQRGQIGPNPGPHSHTHASPLLPQPRWKRRRRNSTRGAPTRHADPRKPFKPRLDCAPQGEEPCHFTLAGTSKGWLGTQLRDQGEVTCPACGQGRAAPSRARRC